MLAELSPLEVYSANKLHDLRHCRLSGPTPFFPSKSIGPIVFQVLLDAEQYIDVYAKSYHVAREGSEHFLEHSHSLPTMDQITRLCKSITCYGKADSKRALGQFRLNIGNGGQNWVNGAPCQLHGLQFQKELEQDAELDSTEVLQSLGLVVEFTWRATTSLQEEAQDHPIAPDRMRKQLYAEDLSKYLNMDKEVGFEDITLVVSTLHPVSLDVSEHFQHGPD